ncbi:hypothetical protein BLA39750_02200 [Burkholderia lata]|uniref:Uncharacterized protein n=1 Tax=Burkholderia lata (strain ATCC 17760 / DSM 23089 / LMG 22485 / NCIMB 9086 / R18194 / 383) TaxID=482957 RepID=A0A6P2WAC1_BURL3|nr:hypothetical protein [Burkholderia lata]VWC95607.1 hypothetical protein BLA39750_02200 [Burkholderia lata]
MKPGFFNGFFAGACIVFAVTDASHHHYLACTFDLLIVAVELFAGKRG